MQNNKHQKEKRLLHCIPVHNKDDAKSVALFLGSCVRGRKILKKYFFYFFFDLAGPVDTVSTLVVWKSNGFYS